VGRNSSAQKRGHSFAPKNNFQQRKKEEAKKKWGEKKGKVRSRTNGSKRSSSTLAKARLADSSKLASSPGRRSSLVERKKRRLHVKTVHAAEKIEWIVKFGRADADHVTRPFIQLAASRERIQERERGETCKIGKTRGKDERDLSTNGRSAASQGKPHRCPRTVRLGKQQQKQKKKTPPSAASVN